MAEGLFIQAHLANAKDAVSGEAVEEVLAGRADVALFRRTWRSGEMRNAAFEWSAVVSVAADLTTLATAFWLIYAKWLKKSPPAAKRSPFLVMQVRHPDGRFKQIVIRPGDSSEKEFMSSFTLAVEQLLQGAENPPASTLCEELEKQGAWVRIKRYET